MRLLMIVQQLDERDWLRGFTVGWIRALAAEIDHLYVLALETAPTELPPNVTIYSMGKEQGYSRPRELLAFYRGIGRCIRDVDGILSHMTPRYTWLAAPTAFLFRKPQMLWFTHRKSSAELRLALSCARWVTTATHDSFPIESPKVHVVGHGIDVERFSPDTTPLDDPPLVLAVGRISPIKNHHILLDVAAQMPDVQFAIAGAPAAPGDTAYLTKLQSRHLPNVQFVGGLATDDLIGWYRRASVVTNLSPPGLFDKAALEAMLTATPLIVTNPAFDALLGDYRDLLRTPDDPREIAQRIRRVMEHPDNIGASLRENTAQAHGLSQLMQTIPKFFTNH